MSNLEKSEKVMPNHLLEARICHRNAPIFDAVVGDGKRGGVNKTRPFLRFLEQM